ncbi:MAG: type II toxin-antitoxin system VapC family toxin [Terrimicrobiaceae bacterium]
MIIPDINLLVYAYNAADPQHDAARAWWESAVGGREPVGVPWIVAGGFIRLMTHPRVLVSPMPVEDATRRVRSWLEHPNVLVVNPGKRFAGLFFGFLEKVGSGGNLTTDAHLAALAVEHQAELNSCDSDFRSFAGLRWRNPL